MIKSKIRNLLYSHSKGQRKLVNRPNKYFADVGKHQPSNNILLRIISNLV